MTDSLNFVFVLGFALITGIRHGIDFDHIAAITDITGSQSARNKGIFYAVLYGLGHGVMVVLLGLILSFIGQNLPAGVDGLFGRIVGVTLIFLGVYVLISLIRFGSRFKMRSRFMLIATGLQFGYHKLLHNFGFSHHHPKVTEEKYGSKTAFGIGLIHGVGAETPTQVGALAAVVGMGGGAKGIVFLLVFVLGIFLSNLVVAVLSSFGFLRAREKSKLYVAVGLLTAVFSLIVGTIFLLGLRFTF